MKKLYNKYRHGIFEEQEYSMPVISRWGTGGGNMPIVLEVLPFDTTEVTSPGNWSQLRWEGAAILSPPECTLQP